MVSGQIQMFHKGGFQKMNFFNSYFIIKVSFLKILVSNYERLLQRFKIHGIYLFNNGGVQGVDSRSKENELVEVGLVA